ncbi:hypothetical protein [Streptomyces sp. NPDC047043]|uniref:hypothetical protein n=1 Tax=Streptomyces sp. NPDC047043 TaxID=3154497 RepID=UPI0033FCACA9
MAHKYGELLWRDRHGARPRGVPGPTVLVLLGVPAVVRLCLPEANEWFWRAK